MGGKANAATLERQKRPLRMDRLRKLERALEWVKPDDALVEKVGGLLWWESRDQRQAGCEIWVRWLYGAEEHARESWHSGLMEGWASYELWDVYVMALRAGWRYPIAHNLCKLEATAELVEAVLVIADADIYQRGRRLVRPVNTTFYKVDGHKIVDTITLVEVNRAFLKDELSYYIEFYMWQGDYKITIDPPGAVVNAILSRYGQWRFRTAPQLRRQEIRKAEKTGGWNIDRAQQYSGDT